MFAISFVLVVFIICSTYLISQYINLQKIEEDRINIKNSNLHEIRDICSDWDKVFIIKYKNGTLGINTQNDYN